MSLFEPSTESRPLPDAALLHHIAILGKTGSGKTVAAKGMVEKRGALLSVP